MELESEELDVCSIRIMLVVVWGFCTIACLFDFVRLTAFCWEGGFLFWRLGCCFFRGGLGLAVSSSTFWMDGGRVSWSSRCLYVLSRPPEWTQAPPLFDRRRHANSRVEAQLQSRERNQSKCFFQELVSFIYAHLLAQNLPPKTYIMRQKKRFSIYATTKTKPNQAAPALNHVFCIVQRAFSRKLSTSSPSSPT